MSWPSMACVQTRQQSVHTNSDSMIDSAALLEYSVRGIFGEGGHRVYLGEERSPDGLNIGDVSSLDEGLELVGLDHPMHVRKFPFSMPLSIPRSSPPRRRSPLSSHGRAARRGRPETRSSGMKLTVISTPSSARMRAA